MLAKLLPHGSRRRARIKNAIFRLRHRRIIEFHKRQYNDYRQEYIRNAVRLYIDSDDSPLISVVVPCYNTPGRYLRELVDSVLAQGYEKWELVLADASTEKIFSKNIRDIAESDMRITYLKIANEGIAVNTNAAIKAAKGDYIAFLDHDDTLDPDALAENTRAILQHAPDLLYSDEDKLSDDSSAYFEPHFKPDFNLPMLRCVNYITHFVVVKKDLALQVGLIEPGFEGAQDYNFLLHVVDTTDKIHHIPKILYHWRQAVNSTASNFSNKKYVTDAGVSALNNHYRRRGIDAKAVAIENRPGFYRTVYALPHKKRAVVLNLPQKNSKERELVVSAYKAHKEIRKYAIDVLETDLHDESVKKYDEILYVNRAVFSLDKVDGSISALFGSLQAGAQFVSLKKVSRSRITDCGLVRYGDFIIPLYQGTDPTLPQYFGSPEWNRQVNGLRWGLVCGKTADILAAVSSTGPILGSNLVMLGQFEYLELHDYATHVPASTDGDDHFNPNLSVEMYPRLIPPEPLAEKVPIKK